MRGRAQEEARYVILIFFHTWLQGICEEKPNDKETIKEECYGVTETLMRAVGTDRSELDETVKTSMAKAVQDRFLKECEETTKVGENRSAEGTMRGSRPDNLMKSRRDDSEFIAIEFDSTLGYPGEGPPRVTDFGSMEDAMSATSLNGEYHVEETQESVRDVKM